MDNKDRPEGKTDTVEFKPIGIIHTAFTEPSGIPIQASAARGARGMVEVLPEYASGLKDLEGFSHIMLLYHFHLARPPQLLVRPFLDDAEHGVFATRAPSRPNPIGISIVRLLQVRGNMIDVEDVDIVDGTPLLDIKPYVPEFDSRQATRIGWLQGKMQRLPFTGDDGRFTA
jgi:tRNA-Thr(GGU) m(6)t(6)A37 methyltransferase TsaA